MSIARLAVHAIAIALAIPAAFIVVPAPAEWLLPFSVVTPEVSLWLAAAAALTAIVAQRLWSRGLRTGIAFVLAALTLAAALIPLVHAPFAVSRFDAAMAAGLGARWAESRDIGRGRPSPFVLTDFVRGFPVDPAVQVVTLTIPLAADRTSRLLIYQRSGTPAPSTLAPAIVQIYGGAWQRGAPEQTAVSARMLAALGYVVFAIDYRHAPAARWPAQIDDVRGAVAWVRAHAAEHGADATRLALVGRSAGAHLALLAAYTDAQPGLRAVVAFYPPTDLAEGWRRVPSPDPADARLLLETFLGGTPDQKPDAYRDASPVTHVRAGLPPTLIFQGARDHIVEPHFGRLLDTRLRAAGVTSIYLELPWSDHAFDFVGRGLGGQISQYYMERFLERSFSR